MGIYRLYDPMGNWSDKFIVLNSLYNYYICRYYKKIKGLPWGGGGGGKDLLPITILCQFHIFSINSIDGPVHDILFKVVSKKSYAQTLKIKGRNVGTITVSSRIYTVKQ